MSDLLQILYPSQRVDSHPYGITASSQTMQTCKSTYHFDKNSLETFLEQRQQAKATKSSSSCSSAGIGSSSSSSDDAGDRLQVTFNLHRKPPRFEDMPKGHYTNDTGEDLYGKKIN